MKNQEFLQIIKSIKPDRDIVAGRRGSEENVKIKILLPLLRFLGYNIVKDVDFERLGADAVIVDPNFKPLFILETKAWEEQIKNYLDQCLEYTLKLNTPLILITSGQETALYSFLGYLDKPHQVKPIIEFRFQDLLGRKSSEILSRLNLLMGKNSLLSGGEELNKTIRNLLPEGHTIEKAQREFIKRCKGFKSRIKTIKITDDEFVKVANKYPEEICNALILAKDEFYKLAQQFKFIRVRYRSRTIGLECLSQEYPRSKKMGLVEINPYTGRLSFGMSNWNKILSSKDTIQKIKEFPRVVKNEAQIRKLSFLLREAIKEISRKSD